LGNGASSDNHKQSTEVHAARTGEKKMSRFDQKHGFVAAKLGDCTDYGPE
jgi:hypothetical protein